MKMNESNVDKNKPLFYYELFTFMLYKQSPLKMLIYPRRKANYKQFVFQKTINRRVRKKVCKIFEKKYVDRGCSTLIFQGNTLNDPIIVSYSFIANK